MADKVRVGFIGAGNLANSIHYPCLASLPDVELVANCDLVVDKARETAERFGIPQTFTDYEEMLAEVDPQVVYVIMPPQHLYAPAAAVLQQGRHLFVEKPLAMTTKQAQMLAYFAEEHSCLTAVGFQRRHIPAMTALKQRVEERGPIHQATVSFLKGGRNRPLDEPAAVYGGVIDCLTVDGIHAVDNLRFLCGGEVEEVSARVRTRYMPGPLPNEFSPGVVQFRSRRHPELQLRELRRRFSVGVQRQERLRLRERCRRVLYQDGRWRAGGVRREGLWDDGRSFGVMTIR